MPISRPLASISKGLHELRLSSRSGEFRVFYFIRVGDSIYIVHAGSKKKQAIDKRTSDLLKKRIGGINL
jgi:phage-related protein